MLFLFISKRDGFTVLRDKAFTPMQNVTLATKRSFDNEREINRNTIKTSDLYDAMTAAVSY